MPSDDSGVVFHITRCFYTNSAGRCSASACSPVVATNQNEEPILQDPIEPIAADEGEQRQPQVEDEVEE